MLRARESIRTERFTFHSSRMRMRNVTPEELAAMNREGQRCVAELADARVDLISTACLVAIMASGPGAHRETERVLTKVARENFCDAHVMTSAGALIEGLQILGAKKISLMAPYVCSLTKLVIEYIEGEGIEVMDSISFEIPDNLEVGRRDSGPAAGRCKASQDCERRRGGVVGLRSNAVSSLDTGCARPSWYPSSVHCGLHGAPNARSSGLEPVLPNAGALLSPDYLATSLPPCRLEPAS